MDGDKDSLRRGQGPSTDRALTLLSEKLIKYFGGDEELSPKTLNNIERALEDVKKGRTYSTSEAKKKLGIKNSPANHV